MAVSKAWSFVVCGISCNHYTNNHASICNHYTDKFKTSLSLFLLRFDVNLIIQRSPKSLKTSKCIRASDTSQISFSERFLCLRCKITPSQRQVTYIFCKLRLPIFTLGYLFANFFLGVFFGNFNLLVNVISSP